MLDWPRYGPSSTYIDRNRCHICNLVRAFRVSVFESLIVNSGCQRGGSATGSQNIASNSLQHFNFGWVLSERLTAFRQPTMPRERLQSGRTFRAGYGATPEWRPTPVFQQAHRKWPPPGGSGDEQAAVGADGDAVRKVVAFGRQTGDNDLLGAAYVMLGAV